MKTRHAVFLIGFALTLAHMLALTACAPAGPSYPYDTKLANSHGNGGWVLFDTVSPWNSTGNFAPHIALEEEAQVTVLGPPTHPPRRPGQTVDVDTMVPIKVTSGKYAGRQGFLWGTKALGE